MGDQTNALYRGGVGHYRRRKGSARNTTYEMEEIGEGVAYPQKLGKGQRHRGEKTRKNRTITPKKNCHESGAGANGMCRWSILRTTEGTKWGVCPGNKKYYRRHYALEKHQPAGDQYYP